MCPENFTEKSTDNKVYMVAPQKSKPLPRNQKNCIKSY